MLSRINKKHCSRKDQAAIVFGSHTRCFKSFAGDPLFQYHLHVGALNASQIQPWSSSTTDAESQSTGGTQLFIPRAPSQHHQGVRHFWRWSLLAACPIPAFWNLISRARARWQKIPKGRKPTEENESPGARSVTSLFPGLSPMYIFLASLSLDIVKSQGSIWKNRPSERRGARLPQKKHLRTTMKRPYVYGRQKRKQLNFSVGSCFMNVLSCPNPLSSPLLLSAISILAYIHIGAPRNHQIVDIPKNPNESQFYGG